MDTGDGGETQEGIRVKRGREEIEEEGIGEGKIRKDRTKH